MTALSESVDLEAFASPEWAEPRSQRAIFASVYEMQAVTPSALDTPIICELKEVRIILLAGAPSFRENVGPVATMWMDADGKMNFIPPDQAHVVAAPPGTYSIFLAPFTQTPGTNEGELTGREKIDVAVAMLGSFQGRNAIHKPIFENVYSYETKQASAWSAPIPTPFGFPRPNITKDGLRPLFAAERARWALSEEQRARLDLSFRWLGQAMTAMGVDSFLKYWFALEVLSMPDSSIRPLNQVLARCYSLPSAADARKTFHTGLLFGLRSRIVHDGLQRGIDGRLLRYCEYLHHDVTRAILQLPNEGRAASLLNLEDFDIAGYLRQALS